jgi:VCBS repeat protein
MGSKRSVLRLFVPLLVLAVVPSALVSVGASRAAASVCGSLNRQNGALASSDELAGVSYVSPSETWAVGNVGAAQRPNQTLTELYNGSVWSVVPSPNQGTGNNALNGVSMIPGAGWAVGYAQVSGKYDPLALGWDGTQWSMASTGTFPSDALLTGVDTLADGSAWAAGFQRTAAGTRQTLIEQESGGTWTPVASPNDGTATTDNSLTAIAGTQDTGLWAVGWRESPGGLQPVILRYDTTQPSPTWVSVTGAGGVPAPGAVDTVLTGVDVLSADDVWAVGYYFDGSVNQPLALHWDGSTWSNSPIPGAGMLRKVRALAPDNVWAAGTVYNGTAQVYQSLVEHFDGTSWTPVESANAPASDTEIIGLATDPGGSSMTLVGRQGSKAVVEQASCPSGPLSLLAVSPAPVPPVPDIPGVGPAPNPPPNTPPATAAIPVTITDQAPAAGISGPQDWTFSASVADFNGDGWPDMFIARHWHPANLWLNNQDGTFSQSDGTYFQSIKDRHDCLAADFDQDGLQDMFCSVGADRGQAAKANALYLQQSGGTFADQAYQWNVTDPWGRGRYGAVLDANNDGYPDVFYGTESLRPDGMPSIDRFYINTGQGSFVDDPAMELDMNIGSLCAHTVDYNSDGWPDLLVCGETGGLHLFRNDQGQGFTDVSSILGTSIKAVDAAMVDVNHDSRPDLITLTGSVLAERLQLANGTFAKQKILQKNIKSARSLAIGDVNGDNNPDIYVVCGRTGSQNAPDYLFTGNATGGFPTAMTIPQATVGGGDTAYPIDYTKDGLDSFLVLNGQVPNAGPIQLLTPQPSGSSALARMTSFKPGAAP